MPYLTGSVSRRTVLRATSAVAAAVAGGVARPSPASAASSGTSSGTNRLFADLEEKIQLGMARYAIPGVAIGILYRDVEYIKGFGVTDVDHPVAVDGETVFRIASTTKTFTATAVMRLAEAGRLVLDAPVRRYLPGFQTLDPGVAQRVTVRQLLNHTAGWLGDASADAGTDDDALARYVAGIARLPQLTAPGRVFGYNSAAVGVAGRLIEAVTGSSYEAAVRELLIDPLGLTHSRFFASDLAGFSVATAHAVDNGVPSTTPDFFEYQRGKNPVGGLISSVRDQVRYARFHLGDGSVPGSRRRLLTATSLRTMRSPNGPGGTMTSELDGIGMSWMLRPSAEGVRIVQHGGDTAGQHSGFLMVPERGFAMTMLTNANGGERLVADLFTDDWALRRFAGITNPPARTRRLSSRDLAGYEGRYTQQSVDPNGGLVTSAFEITASDGGLVATMDGMQIARAAFYRPDHVVMISADPDQPGQRRADFVRGQDGRVAWLRLDGRLIRHESAR